jgi:hypothetical protein
VRKICVGLIVLAACAIVLEAFLRHWGFFAFQCLAEAYFVWALREGDRNLRATEQLLAAERRLAK